MKTRKVIFKISFAIIMMCLISCNNENQFDVGFTFPNAKTNGILSRFVTNYGLRKYKVPVNADSLLAFTDELQKEIFGGIPIAGTLTINEDNITFEPQWGTSLCAEGYSAFKVPMNDIDSVRSESYLLIAKSVVVSTKNGEFKFNLGKSKHAYNPFEYEDEDIIKLIEEKRNNK